MAYITTHRLMWVDPGRKYAAYWNLSEVHSIQEQSGFGMFSHPKVIVSLTNAATPSRASATPLPNAFIKLSFQVSDSLSHTLECLVLG